MRRFLVPFYRWEVSLLLLGYLKRRSETGRKKEGGDDSFELLWIRINNPRFFRMRKGCYFLARLFSNKRSAKDSSRFLPFNRFKSVDEFRFFGARDEVSGAEGEFSEGRLFRQA